MVHKVFSMIALLFISLGLSADGRADGAATRACARPSFAQRMRASFDRSLFVASGRFESAPERATRPHPDDYFERESRWLTFVVHTVHKGDPPKEQSIPLRFLAYPPLPIDNAGEVAAPASEPLTDLSQQLRDLEFSYANDCLDTGDNRARSEDLIERIRKSPEYHEGEHLLVSVLMGPMNIDSGGTEDMSGRSADVLVEFGKPYTYMTRRGRSEKNLAEGRTLDNDLYSEAEMKRFGKGLLDVHRKKW